MRVRGAHDHVNSFGVRWACDKNDCRMPFKAELPRPKTIKVRLSKKQRAEIRRIDALDRWAKWNYENDRE